ncbi:MAG TPA: hypothetical protein VK745_10645 [Polyangiaceae bacterium]|nr:hypothetical protein [Polyangiaceae bacterium]
MSELRRWSEEGARGDAALLLEASRRERAPAQARARTLEALGVAVAGSAAATSTALAATNAATKGGLTLLLKAAALSLVGGGIIAGVAVVHSAQLRAARSSPVTVDSTAVEPRSVEPPVEAVPVPVVDAPSPAPSAAPSEHASRPDHPAARASASAEVLARELKALELVHQALLGHDPNAALRLLDRYQAQFPHGSLASEATVLRAQALLANGDRARAQALVDSYCSAHPDSPYAKRLNELVHGK